VEKDTREERGEEGKEREVWECDEGKRERQFEENEVLANKKGRQTENIDTHKRQKEKNGWWGKDTARERLKHRKGERHKIQTDRKDKKIHSQ